jgi:hypothetical protein
MNANRGPRFLLIETSSRLPSGSLSRDPLAHVWIAIRQRNASRLALSEKIDTVLTGQSHILEVKSDWAIFSLRPDEFLQLNNILLLELAA